MHPLRKRSAEAAPRCNAGDGSSASDDDASDSGGDLDDKDEDFDAGHHSKENQCPVLSRDRPKLPSTRCWDPVSGTSKPLLLVSAGPLSSGRSSGGSCRGVSAPFKCPMPNYRAPTDKPIKTLGPKRSGYSAIFGSMGRVLMASEARAAPALPKGEPLLVFDPETSTTVREDKSSLSKVYVHAFIAAKLRPHQVEGVRFMAECLMGIKDPRYTGCILADGMGLGKTFQSCAIIHTLLTTGIHGGQATVSRPLILCPSSLVSNWGKELIKWLEGGVEPVLLDDTKAATVKDTLARYGATVWKKGGPPKVLVMSFTTFNTHKALVYNKGIDMVVVDEAHFIKNGSSQISLAVDKIPAKTRLLLTGTPVQNVLTEFFTLMNLSVPGLLGQPSAFRKHYELPITRGQDTDATEKEASAGKEKLKALLELCSLFMLRRTSTINKQYLPKCVETVLFCAMAPLQTRLYDFFLASAPVRRTVLGKAAADGPDLQPLPAITALKKLCCHPDLIYSMFSSGQGAGSALQRSGSGRVSGGAVSGGAGGGCRQGSEGGREGGARSGGAVAAASSVSSGVITGFDGCMPVFRETSTVPVYEPRACQLSHSGKLYVLHHLLKAIRLEDATDKVVLVSNYTEALDLLAKMCTCSGWQYLRLDGSCNSSKRQPLVDRFNLASDPSFVLLLSSKAGGTGLNIIGANRLVLLDPDWNPANDAQAMARVWREGQLKPVWIYRMLTTGSIEEKVYQRQLSKMGLSRSVVDKEDETAGGGAAEVQKFSADELKSLFKVEKGSRCDTHRAIKCSCLGLPADMKIKADAEVARKLKRQQQQEQQQQQRGRVSGSCGAGGSEGAPSSACAMAVASGGGGEKPIAALDAGVREWAHLVDPALTPDAVWRHIPPPFIKRFVTFVFSDHLLDPDIKGKAIHEARGSEEEEEEEEKGDDMREEEDWDE